MAQTLVGLGFSTATGRLRFVVVPTDDSQIAAHGTAGITVLSITNAQYAAAPDHAALQALVNTARGSAPVNDRVIYLASTGVVVAWGYFDAACGDTVPAGQVLAHHATRSTDWPTTPPLRRSALVDQAGTFLRVIETEYRDTVRQDVT
jgi:hypothetical protein